MAKLRRGIQPEFNLDRILNTKLSSSQLKDLEWLKSFYLSSKDWDTRKNSLIHGLPHLFGYPWYSWARELFESKNKLNFLTAANQVSKSSTIIRKAIHWATAKSLWGDLWEVSPQQFWYFYPDRETATIEFDTKWEPEFLSRGVYRDRHPWFKWEASYIKDQIHSVHFGSGVSIFFKTYTQKVKNLQAGTVHAIFLDEELPEEFWPELYMRGQSVDGYIHHVFTATLNQEFWRSAMEEHGTTLEKFPQAWKRQISLYDCRKYEDGQPARYHSLDKIDRIKAACGSPVEVKRRVYGKFIKLHGRKYSAFDPSRHFTKGFSIPYNWPIYVAADHGTGGGSGHPSAVCFLAVNPECTKGYIFKGWRGDDEVTTASDLFYKYLEMKGRLSIVQRCYDYSAKDFGIIASRANEPFSNADKSVEKGVDLVNTLFRCDMLFIFSDNYELKKLGNELLTVTHNEPKSFAKDDLADTVRYNVGQVPWNFLEAVPELKEEVDKNKEVTAAGRAFTKEEYLAWEIDQRRGFFGRKEDEGWDEATREIEFWNGEQNGGEL